MEDAELAALIREKTEQLDGLPDGSEQTLTKEEKSQRRLLEMEREVLQRIVRARENSSVFQEVRAGVDYALLKKYGHKSSFWASFLRSQVRWWGF